jgi:hypothetical protein
MCEPVSIGIATAVIGGIGAVGAYQQQQQQVAYANQQAIAQADYQRQVALYQAQEYNRQVAFTNQQNTMATLNQRMSIANQNLNTQIEYLNQQQQREYQGLQQQLQYQTDLNKSILSQASADTQLELNQRATSRVFQAEQQKLSDAQAQAAFEGQKILATSLQTQGTVLGSGRSGQSIGLLVGDAQRRAGQDSAIVSRNIDTAYGDYLNNSGIAVLRQLTADAQAISSILPEPIKPLPLPELAPPSLAPLPEYGPDMPFKTDIGPVMSPVLASGPSSIGLIGGIGSSILGGVNAGYQMAALQKQLG